MSRVSLLVGASMAAMSTATSAAAPIDLKKLCEAGGPGQINPVKLVYAALAAAGNPGDAAFDVDLDGAVTMPERLTAIVDPTHCAVAAKGRCSEGDQGKLDDARSLLQSVLFSDPQSPTSDDEVQVRLETIREPTALEIRERRELGDEQFARFAQALDERRRFLRIACTPAASGQPVAAVLDKPRPRGGLRLTSDIDSLGLPRGTPDQLAKVPQAEISYRNDKEKERKVFDISAVLGFDLSRNPDRSFIPFVEVKRKRVEDTSGDPPTPPEEVADEDKDLSEFSFGLAWSALFESRDEISVAPLISFDDEADSSVGALRASWTPGFLQEIDFLPFGASRKIGPLAVELDLRALMQLGHVFDPGTNDDLKEQGDYFRVGLEGKIFLWSLANDKFFSRFSADATWKRLAAVAGDKVKWFDVGINWSADETDHVTVRYSYERGRDDETLKRSEAWKLSVGLRF
jgi:hypothetical protein